MKSIVALFALIFFSSLSAVLAGPLPEKVSLVPTDRPVSIANEIRGKFANFKTVVHQEDEEPWDETPANIQGSGGKSYSLNLFHGEGMETLEVTLNFEGHTYTVDDNGADGTCFGTAGEEIPCEEIDGQPDAMLVDGDVEVVDQQTKKLLSEQFAEAVDALLAYEK